MIIINESSYLANIVKDKVEIDDTIKLYSTKGMLFNYKMIEKSLNVTPRFDKKNQIKYLKQLKLKNEIIIIATDQDSTGELIALEILSLIPNALKFKLKFEDILNMGKITEDRILKYSNKEYNIELAKLYIQEKIRDNDIYEIRKNILSEIIQNNIKKIIIPNDLMEKKE